MDRRAARGAWRRGGRHARPACTQHQVRHPAPAGGDAGGHRARRRPVRGQHLPGRAVAAADVLPATRAGLGALSHADRRTVAVRLGHAPRRRRHGRFGPQCRLGDAWEMRLSLHAIVIGAGADALVAAHLLARRGKQVLVVEERAPAAQDFGWVPSQVLRALGLELKADAPDPWITTLLPEGGRLELWRDPGRASESIRRYSERDARRWPDFCRRMAALARLFEQIYLAAPVDPLNLRFALRVRGLGREGMVDL